MMILRKVLFTIKVALVVSLERVQTCFPSPRVVSGFVLAKDGGLGSRRTLARHSRRMNPIVTPSERTFDGAD